MIVGGGFAGLHLVRHLERALRRGEADVTLLDRNNYHLFTPLLYQVATGELPPHAVAYPLRRATATARFRFINSEVEAIDLEQRLVQTADGPLPYDYAVLTPGSVSNDYGIAGVTAHTLPLKELGDGLAVRGRILASFEEASRERDPARRKELLTFVIIGAGPVGVELATSLRELVDHSLRPMYPEIDVARDVEIVLLDGSDRVLPRMDDRLGRIAARRLERQRIRVLLRTFVTEVVPGRVRTRDGAEHAGHTLVWAGGVRVSPLAAALPAERSHDGRLLVDEALRLRGRTEVFCCGDAAYVEVKGQPLAQLAQVAVVEAPAVAANIVRALRGAPLVPYRHKEKGDLIALGRTNAGARLGNVVFEGLPAWTVWRGNYLLQLLGVRNRATLLAEWVLSYFFTRMVANTP